VRVLGSVRCVGGEGNGSVRGVGCVRSMGCVQGGKGMCGVKNVG